MKIARIAGYKNQVSSLNSKNNIRFGRLQNDVAQNDVFVKRTIKSDNFGGNVFQFGTIEEIESVSKGLTREEIVNGIFATNITGANAMHLAENDPKRIKFLCSYLEPTEIASISIMEDGYKRAPFLDFKGDSFEALMEKISEADVKKLILCTQKDDNSNCLYTFEADKIKTLFDKMNKKDIKELCMQQDKSWGNTPFHLQTKEAFEVLRQSLEPDDLADVCSVENAYKESIKDILLYK